MNNRTFVGLVAAAFLAAAMPSTAYHIDGVTPGGAAPGTALTAADWHVATCINEPTMVGTVFCLNLCELEWGAGSAGSAADDRLAFPGDMGNNGEGGLCTTGRNDATGLSETAPPPAPRTTWTKLEVCDETTVGRNGVDGPFLPGTAAACVFPASTTNIGFTAEIGVYSCFVSAAKALVYDEWYASMNYDGDGGYTGGDAPGFAHTGNGVVDTILVDHYQAWTGHVAVFVDAQDAAAASVTEGSVETSVYTPAGATIIGACGTSPGGAGTPVGPVGIL